MPDEDKNLRGSKLALDSGIWWLHEKTMYNLPTLKFKTQPTNAVFARQSNVRRLLPASNYYRTLFRCLNCAQRFEYRALGCSWKLSKQYCGNEKVSLALSIGNKNFDAKSMFLWSIKYFRTRAVGLNASRDRISQVSAISCLKQGLKGAPARREDEIPRLIYPHLPYRATRGETLTTPYTTFLWCQRLRWFYISHKYFHYKIPLNAPMRHKWKKPFVF